MTQNTDLEQQGDEVLRDAEARAELERLRAMSPKPMPVLREGKGNVRLVMSYEDVFTPEEAVEAFINEIVRNGLNDLMFVVDDGEDVFYVLGGEVVDLQDDGEGGFNVVDYYADPEDDEDDDAEGGNAEDEDVPVAPPLSDGAE